MSTTEDADSLCDPVLIDLDVRHGFGQIGSQVPESTVFSEQVHGVEVIDVDDLPDPGRSRADALFTGSPGRSVGIVTADCVPILVAACDTSVVAAVHAGWRGLAAGVIEAALAAIRTRAGGAELAAAVGPAARACCYEVDEPVRAALAERYAAHLEEVLVVGRPDRYQLDLPQLATRVLAQNGLSKDRIGVQNRVCTICDPIRFESYRRDGAAAGRLRHFIACPMREEARVDSLRARS